MNVFTERLVNFRDKGLNNGANLDVIGKLCLLSYRRNQEIRLHEENLKSEKCAPRSSRKKARRRKTEDVNDLKYPSPLETHRRCLNILMTSSLFSFIISLIVWVFNASFSLSTMYDDLFLSECLVDKNFISQEATRPITNCGMCEGLRQVRVVENITREDFAVNHAYSGVPVVVKGATVNWTAMAEFSFQFFKDAHKEFPLALDNDECQFFSYKSSFFSLAEVLEMPSIQAAFGGNEIPWYIGWSNCDPDIAGILRRHYSRPAFLPNNSESSWLDWIFMGGSGPGAQIHIDYVSRPSWQAQISGRKTWTLIPPPKCDQICKTLTVTVETGDIVCINTNEWYHSTFVEPGNISITIGSEYD